MKNNCSAAAEMGDRGRANWAEKVGAAVPLSVQGAPHLTQCRLGRGLPPYQLASWSIQPFGYNTPTSPTDRQDIERHSETKTSFQVRIAYLLTSNGIPKLKRKMCTSDNVVRPHLLRPSAACLQRASDGSRREFGEAFLHGVYSPEEWLLIDSSGKKWKLDIP